MAHDAIRNTPDDDARDAPFLRLVSAMVGSKHPGTAAEERSYRSFIEALGVAVYTTDADGKITFFNDAAAQLWGRRPDIGEEWCGSLRLFWPDGTPMDHGDCPMAIALHENRAVRGMSAMAQRPDGSFVDFDAFPTPLQDEDGHVVGAVNVLVDITERRRAEDDLRAAAEALTASNDVKDEFLGLVSHELRTPVTTIYGNAQLLRDRMARLSPEAQAAMIADMAEDSDRLLAIVENLLLLSRLQAGARPDVEPLLLTHVARQEVTAFARRHAGAVVRLAPLPPEHIMVDADRGHLMVLIQNLLSNAYKYGRSSEGIDVIVSLDDDEAKFRVLDRGVGIDGIDPDALFDPFYRSPSAQKMASGVGLGLPVCRRIVSALGGRIWGLAREGGGSEFGFAIPISAHEAEPV